MSFGICICTQMGKHKCHMQNDLGCRLTHRISFFSIHWWISTIIWKGTSIMWHLNLHGEQFLQISRYLLRKILYSSAKYALAFKVEVMYMILSWYMIYDIIMISWRNWLLCIIWLLMSFYSIWKVCGKNGKCYPYLFVSILKILKSSTTVSLTHL